MKSKKATYKQVLKHNLFSFLSYSILIGFIFLLVVLFFKYALLEKSSLPLSIALSLICGIFIYHLLHFICKSSTLESLRKSYLDTENSILFLRKMNLFFVLCILTSFVICITYIIIHHIAFLKTIDQTYIQYEFISEELATRITDLMVQKYQHSYLNKIFSTIIIELSFIISFSSLINYQKKVFDKFNT